MASSANAKSTTVILVIWRHFLNLTQLKKPQNIRLIAIGPSNMIVDESCIDLIHHVEGPITPRDQNNVLLLQKVRELCAALSVATSAGVKECVKDGEEITYNKIALCAFERSLQRDIAEIRLEFDIEGMKPAQFDQLLHRRSIRAVCRRGGLSTLKAISLGSVQGQPDAWVEYAGNQVGTYPMFLRPVNIEANCMHTLCIAYNADELRSWIRTRHQNPNYNTEYLAEECLENGYEFLAVVSCTTGLIGTFSTVDTSRTLYASVRSQLAYSIEYLSADRTRDVMPGVESFVLQCMKSVFSRSLNCLLFIKGFYRGHNSITFLGGSLELRKRSLATLFQEANDGKPWESFAVEAIIKSHAPPLTAVVPHMVISLANDKNGATRARFSSLASTEAPGTGVPSVPPLCCRHSAELILTVNDTSARDFYALINFPCSEGFLLHQTTIPPTNSERRLAWRVSEGEELLDSDGIDENVLQIFLRNPRRKELLVDVGYLIKNVDITIDKMCLTEKRVTQTQCNSRYYCNPSALNSYDPKSSHSQLIRSCTTAD